MNQYDVNTLCKDITFIENGLTIVNQSRRQIAETTDSIKAGSKGSKGSKFLRYF